MDKVDFYRLFKFILDISHFTSFICVPQDGGEGEAPVRVLVKADLSCRESLQAEAEVDPMDGEQTWPTETELLEADGTQAEMYTW